MKTVDVPGDIMVSNYLATGASLSDEVYNWLNDHDIISWRVLITPSYVNTIRQLWNVRDGYKITFDNDDDATLFTLRWSE